MGRLVGRGDQRGGRFENGGDGERRDWELGNGVIIENGRTGDGERLWRTGG